MVSNKSSGRGAWLKPAYFSFTPEICQSLTPVYELPNIPVCGVQDLRVSSAAQIGLWTEGGRLQIQEAHPEGNRLSSFLQRLLQGTSSWPRVDFSRRAKQSTLTFWSNVLPNSPRVLLRPRYFCRIWSVDYSRYISRCPVPKEQRVTLRQCIPLSHHRVSSPAQDPCSLTSPISWVHAP